MGETARRRVLVLAVALVTVAVLGPALFPGYTLIGDQVFVPDQSLLPWMLGLGAGLPRSVPQDAVVALVSGPVPGWLWEKLALVTALAALGLGVARLLRPAGARAALVGAVVAMWSPYVGERLLLGHWSLLLAVAMLPWALVHASAAHEGSSRAVGRWLLVLALASLTVTGGLLVLALTAPLVLWTGGGPRRPRVGGALAGLVLQLPWLVPAVVHPGSGSSGGADVFALRSEGFGALLTALGTGGIWDADAVPGSRATVLGLVLTVSLLCLGWAGRGAVRPVLGRPVMVVLVVGSVAGLAVALCGAWSVTASLTQWWVAHVPGGGLVRDGQKWLAPWLVLLSVSAALGAVRVSRWAGRRTRDPLVAALLVVAAVALPIACLPDIVWGSTGRLASVGYPDDWAQVRAVLAADPAPGDVVSLPWASYRRFGWNPGRTVLDPAPRFMTRTVVTSDSLIVRHAGTLVVVPGDDPRATAIGAEVDSGRDLAPILRAEGIGWVLVAKVGPAQPLPSGAVAVVTGPDLGLYRLTAPAAAPQVSGAAAVLTGDALAAGVVISALVVALAGIRPRRPAGSSRTAATGW